MKFQRSFAILSIATSASVTAACVPSIEQLPPQTAVIPARLLSNPPTFPAAQRTVDPLTGKLTIDGGQCLINQVATLDVGGQIRGQLVDLIAAVKARDAAPAPKKHRHLF